MADKATHSNSVAAMIYCQLLLWLMAGKGGLMFHHAPLTPPQGTDETLCTIGAGLHHQWEIATANASLSCIENLKILEYTLVNSPQ